MLWIQNTTTLMKSLKSQTLRKPSGNIIQRHLFQREMEDQPYGFLLDSFNGTIQDLKEIPNYNSTSNYPEFTTSFPSTRFIDMGAYTQYSKMFRNGIIAKAEELGYSAANICILKGDIHTLKAYHPHTYSNLISCRHNRDARTPIEYGRDLVASWIFEDSLVQKLSEGGLTSTLAGADRNREVLPTTKVSASSDCRISNAEKSRYLEIMSDYTGWWERTGHIDLRDSKYKKLQNEDALFLGVCTLSNKFILLDFTANLGATYIPAHIPYGGKPAYSIPVKKDALKSFRIPTLIDDLRRLICGS